MAQVKDGDTVSVHYTGKLEDGSVFDTSENRDPLTFTVGQRMVIPGFEEAVLGMAPGDSINTKIPADEAYGLHEKERIIKVERTALPQDFKPETGMRYDLSTDTGQVISVLVVEQSDENVTFDANHPLAGQDLYFDISLVEIT